MRRLMRRGKIEPVISLINIVFLILIFFMVAGTLSSIDNRGISFVTTEGLECCEELDAIVITMSGELFYEGTNLPSIDDFLTTFDGDVVRLLPDKELSATILLRTAQELEAGGVERILVLSESRGG